MKKKLKNTQDHSPAAPDFSPLISALHEVTQALHNCNLANLVNAQGQSEQPLDTAPSLPPKKTSPDPQREPDQIRCYRVPGHIVLQERNLLSEYQAKDLRFLLEQIRDELSVPALFLQLIDGDAEITDGFALKKIGEQLDHAYTMLNRLYSILWDFELQPSVSNDSGF